MGTFEEVAGAVVWLCSAAAAVVTGHTMLVDGGYTAHKKIPTDVMAVTPEHT